MDPLDLIASGKIKRYFRATRKLTNPGLISHITQRAAGKEPLFIEDSDYLFMLGLLKEISLKYGIALYAFCLMPNHVHLLLRPEDTILFDAMRDLFSRYAMWFNRKYERKGHLFGGPYRQAICFDDRYLLAASLYIHLNPVRAAIVAEPESYRWSSIRLYSTRNPPRSFVTPDFILGMLSGGVDNRPIIYRNLLKKGIRIEAGHVLEQEDAVEWFGIKLAAIFPALFKRVEKKKKVAALSDMDLLSVETLAKRIEAFKEDDSLTFPESRKAKKFLIDQLMSRDFSRTEIAGRLGISRKTVYNILRTVK